LPIAKLPIADLRTFGTVQSEIGNWQSEMKRMAENQENESTNIAEAAPESRSRANRSQKVGTVASDKMQKTVVVRVDRLVRHRKYRRYVRRTSKFMAHDELGATVGDKVRIVETRPLSARKRWRVVEIVQKAAK
jgi:small subunit ribosomal protein S17